jgi:hypothetical protein
VQTATLKKNFAFCWLGLLMAFGLGADDYRASWARRLTNILNQRFPVAINTLSKC